MDIDKNGVLDEKEMESAISVLSTQSMISEEELKKIVKEVDTNGDGKINYKEFLAATTPLSKILTKEKLGNIFK